MPRHLVKLAAALVAAALVAACGAAPPPAARTPTAAPEPGTRRTGTYWYFVDSVVLDQLAKESPAVLLWAALPLNRPGQQVKILDIRPKPTEILEEPLGGNRVAFWRVDNPQPGASLTFRYDFEVVSRPVRPAIDPKKVTPAPRDTPDYRRYTISEGWLEQSPAIAARARAIVGAETNPYLQAQRVFDWIVENVTYDYPDIKSRGVTRAFAHLKGDCGEFSHIFVAMMRSLGVPARLVFANWFQGGGHAWAEVLLPPYGWVPVDASGAQLVKNGLKGQLSEAKVKEFMETRGVPTRDPRFLFGNLYPHRLEVFVGENVDLHARAPGGSRTFFFMQPGGANAWPSGVVLPGLSPRTLHEGLFTFGPPNEAAARAKAEVEWIPGLLRQGQHARALQVIRRALAEKPRDGQLLFSLGQAHFDRGQWPPALQAFDQSIAAESGGSIKRTRDTWAHILAGMCLDALGRRADAVARYQAALAAGADHAGSLSVARKHLKTPFVPKAPPR
jgi:transglutaminase-like putative cysteine protease